MKRILTASFALCALSACEQALTNPVPVTLQTQSGFTLQTKRGAIDFAPSSISTGTIELKPLKREVVFTLSQGAFAVKGIAGGAADTVFQALPARSGLALAGGEGVGLEATRTLLCQPDCERVETRIEEAPCTSRGSWGNGACVTDPSGRTICSNPGGLWGITQQVEVKLIHRNYQLDGRFYSAQGTTLAVLSAQYPDVERIETPLGMCY